MLAASALSARRALRSPTLSQRIAQRGLGDTVTGPALTDVKANWRVASELFTKGALSYAEYKQQCVSLRLFAFAGVTAGCALALFLDPPKSSYWQRFSPTWWIYHFRQLFSSSKAPLFLTEKLQHEIDVPSLVGIVIPKGKIGEQIVAAHTVKKPRVLFVLGGPGAGKGTQCGKIVEAYDNWSHISAGDCLRAERKNPQSKDGELINNIIKEGRLVPSEITTRLIEKEMAIQQKAGKTSFLIDGFPRSISNLEVWEKQVGDRANVLGVLHYDAKEEEMTKRLLGRGATSGRVDDNLESIKKRFQTHLAETQPIIEKYAAKGMVFEINGMPAPEEVWVNTQKTVQKVEGM